MLVQTDGTRYKGHFLNGLEDGHGIRIDKDGVRMEGNFKQGKKDGEFTETDASGNVKVVKYRDGRIQPN